MIGGNDVGYSENGLGWFLLPRHWFMTPIDSARFL
jgi:hypothetical protein